MVNEILMRGATPIAMPQPVEAPAVPAGADDFSKALLAELDGPAPAATQGLGAPPAPKAITLETIPVQAPVMVAPPTPPAPATHDTYTVQAGDSLSKIARKLGAGSWNQLYAANKAVIGSDPDVIHPGQVLTLPAAWQAAAAKAAHAPSVKAAVEPAAQAPTVVAGTAPAQVPSAPIVAPPSLPVEAAHEGQPAEVGTVAAPEVPTAAVVGVATEAIDRLTTEPAGGQDHMATLREALKSIPPGHASYEAYKAKVDAYEAAASGAPVAGPAPAAVAPDLAPPPAGAAPDLAPPQAAQAPVEAFPPVDATPSAYGPGAPAGATIDAQLTQPAVPVVAPAEDAGDASADGEEGWQAFS